MRVGYMIVLYIRTLCSTRALGCSTKAPTGDLEYFQKQLQNINDSFAQKIHNLENENNELKVNIQLA